MNRNQAKEFYPILQAYAEGRVIECRTKPSAKLPDGHCDLVRTDVWNGRVNHPEEHDIVKYTAISWYREEFVGGVDLGRNYMHAKYKFFELVVNKKYILEMKHKKNEN